MNTEMKSIEKTARIQNWIQDDKRCVRGLLMFEQANSIRELTIATLKKQHGDGWNLLWQIKVRNRPSGLFDVLVFKRITMKTVDLDVGDKRTENPKPKKISKRQQRIMKKLGKGGL